MSHAHVYTKYCPRNPHITTNHPTLPFKVKGKGVFCNSMDSMQRPRTTLRVNPDTSTYHQPDSGHVWLDPGLTSHRFAAARKTPSGRGASSPRDVLSSRARRATPAGTGLR